MWTTFNKVSGNKKTGPIGVSTTEEKSCPTECPLKGTDCYARFGPLGIHWRKVKERGSNWSEFCKRIAKLPKNFVWRHNQAGDLPQDKRGLIQFTKLRELVRAAKKTVVWTYTHYDPNKKTNAKAIKYANDNGFTVNLSADSVEQADQYVELEVGPVTVILRSDAPHRGNRTPNGLPIVVCPAQTNEDITCQHCMLCQKRDRKSIVGFLAHGTAQKRLSKRLA